MRLLIINEYISYGGTEIQTQREINNLKKHGHEVFLLTFDNNNDLKLDNHINIPTKKNKVAKMFSVFFDLFFYKKIKKIIKKINPDYIHINNIYTKKKEVYKILKNYKTIQTIRDYHAVCPKNTCIYGNNVECDGFIFSDKCKQCKSGMMMKLKIHLFKKEYNSKRKSIKKFVCPSEALTKKCQKNGYNISCINNPFDFDKIIVHQKQKGNLKKYLYYGLISDFKGIFQLIEAFNTFSSNKTDVELLIIGKIDDKIKEDFLALVNATTKINYLGPKKNDEILHMFEEIYCTVVPSLWIENYPNTVLESKANQTLVIGSNRGGIVEMIHNDKLLFSILEQKSIVDTLEYTYNLSYEEYTKIIKSNQEEVLKINSLEAYYCALMNEFEKIGE